MSVVNIVDHDENIYNVQKKKEHARIVKPIKYHSKFKEMVREEWRAAQDGHRTMGYAEVPLDPPSDFLRKDHGVRYQAPLSPRQRLCTDRRPPIPKPEPKCTCRSAAPQRDFKAENIERVVSAHPRRPMPKFCDTSRGDFHPLKPSGLTPIFVYSPKFGKVPGYLVRRKAELAERERAARKEELKKQPKCRYVSAEERERLLNGLKENWENLQKNYQSLPLMIDTIPKMIRKTKLEGTLKALERDILLMENNPYIYVYDDDGEGEVQAEGQ